MSVVEETIEFEIDDVVKWQDYIGHGASRVYSMFPNYGRIVKLTPQFADVFNEYTEKVERVRKSELNWS